jgi:FkbM family methyltransferase
MSSGRSVQHEPHHYGRVLSSWLHKYYTGKDHPGKLRLLRIIEALLGDKRIIVRTSAGFEMAVDHMDYVQRIIFFDGEYEPEITALLRKELNKGDIFYDIGANVGYYTCLAEFMGVTASIAFEPDPLNCSIIKMNLVLNKCRNNCSIIEVGVGDTNELKTFCRAHVHNSGMSGFSLPTPVDQFEVNVDTLDGLIDRLKLPKPTVMKVDVEGWEQKVFSKAEAALSDHSLRMIIFEADVSPNLEVLDSSLVSILKGHNFVTSRIKRNSGIIESKENFIAVR